jgi:hypothetical protein
LVRFFAAVSTSRLGRVASYSLDAGGSGDRTVRVTSRGSPVPDGCLFGEVRRDPSQFIHGDAKHKRAPGNAERERSPGGRSGEFFGADHVELSRLREQGSGNSGLGWSWMGSAGGRGYYPDDRRSTRRSFGWLHPLGG